MFDRPLLKLAVPCLLAIFLLYTGETKRVHGKRAEGEPSVPPAPVPEQVAPATEVPNNVDDAAAEAPLSESQTAHPFPEKAPPMMPFNIKGKPGGKSGMGMGRNNDQFRNKFNSITVGDTIKESNSSTIFFKNDNNEKSMTRFTTFSGR